MNLVANMTFSPHSRILQYNAPSDIFKVTLLRDDGEFLTKANMEPETVQFYVLDDTLTPRIRLRYHPHIAPPNDWQQILGSGFFNQTTQQFELSFAESYDPPFDIKSSNYSLRFITDRNLTTVEGRHKTVQTEFKPSGTGRTYVVADFEKLENQVPIGQYQIKLPYVTHKGGQSMSFFVADNQYFGSPGITNVYSFPVTHVECGSTFSISIPHKIRYLTSTEGFVREPPFEPSALIVMGDGTNFVPGAISDPFIGVSIEKTGTIKIPPIEYTAITTGDMTGVNARFTEIRSGNLCHWTAKAIGITSALQVHGYVIELVAEA